MKVAADSSVLIAAFATWHERHAEAFRAMERVDTLVGHTLLEVFSVLTRLPPPHRVEARLVATWLRDGLGEAKVVSLPPVAQRKLIAACAARGLLGGAVYDALIAASAAHARARLLTLDARAQRTYGAMGVDFEVLANADTR